MAATKAAAKAVKAGAKSSASSAAKATKASTTAKRSPGGKSAAPAKKVAGKKASVPKKAAVAKKPAAARKAPARKAAAAKKPAVAKKAPAKARTTSGKAAAKSPAGLDKFLRQQLAVLEDERATYARQAASLRAEADLLAAEREPGDVQFDEESGEGDTLAVERERDLALSAQAAAAVEEIDLAIERIHAGTYGVCERCGKAIPKERLLALPQAALCVQCKTAGFSRR